MFKRNYQFAKDSAAKNKKDLGLDFNPGPSAPRDDGTREANENRIGPFYNLAGLITHITVQGAKVDHSDDDSDTDEAPAPAPKPQKQKKTKASKTSASRAKSLATAPSAPSNNSEDLSRISMRREKTQKTPVQQLSHALTPAAIMRNESEAIEQGFYPCMVRGPQPADADPSSLLWCRDDNLFKRNF